MRTYLILSFLLLLGATAPLAVFEAVISAAERAWRTLAIEKLWEERVLMGHTPLVRMEVPSIPTVDLFIKNETATASGTLKHRFVWNLIKWAVEKGWITSKTILYDSTSGNTGASEGYMCRLIGLQFVAVVAKELEEEKVKQITQFGAQIQKVPVQERNYWAEKLAAENGGFFINQFANADAAEEYHESGNYTHESTNVFHEIVVQLRNRNFSLPDYFVHSAGTGGTISSVGKYITRYALPTKVVLADSENSLFYDYVGDNKYANLSAGDEGRPAWVSPGIAGIGYGYNPAPIVFKKTTSLQRSVIDERAKMPDMAAVAAMRVLSERLGVNGGPSTALNFLVSLEKGIEHERKNTGKRLSIVYIMGDPGRFYLSTYLNDTWVEAKMAGGMKALNCWKEQIKLAIDTRGYDFLEKGVACAV